MLQDNALLHECALRCMPITQSVFCRSHLLLPKASFNSSSSYTRACLPMSFRMAGSCKAQPCKHTATLMLSWPMLRRDPNASHEAKSTFQEPRP